MITRACHACGTDYQTYPSIKLKYCSRQCSHEAKKRGEWADCAQCDKSFWKFKSRPNSLYCSKSCARTAANLTDKNPAYHRDISGENNPMYIHGLRSGSTPRQGLGLHGPDNPMYGKRKELAPQWKGGRKRRKDGYILIVVPDNHPYPAYAKPSGLKYILEHRLVMEQHIGRYLDPKEVVHHIDGNPSNNSIDNLMLYKDQAEHMTRGH